MPVSNFDFYKFCEEIFEYFTFIIDAELGSDVWESPVDDEVVQLSYAREQIQRLVRENYNNLLVNDVPAETCDNLINNTTRENVEKSSEWFEY